jgi:hypothetical protein
MRGLGRPVNDSTEPSMDTTTETTTHDTRVAFFPAYTGLIRCRFWLPVAIVHVGYLAGRPNSSLNLLTAKQG